MFKRILLPLDLSEESSWRKALPAAIELCRDRSAELHVLTVVPDFGMTVVGQFFPEDFEKNMAETVSEQLETFVGDRVPGDIKAQHLVGEGTVYEVVLQTARKIGADLIVVAAHRPALKDYLLGPNAARIVRHADCSVLVVRE